MSTTNAKRPRLRTPGAIDDVTTAQLIPIDYLLVGPGGGGGLGAQMRAGGAGGQVIYVTGQGLTPGAVYSAVVGTGGAAGSPGSGPTSLTGFPSAARGNSSLSLTGGNGFGGAGGSGVTNGAGGGASGVSGGASGSGTTGGNGAPGVNNSITGTSLPYGGGGGGGGSVTRGTATHGGGNGGQAGGVGASATAPGGGGGGGGSSVAASGTGMAGVVIIRVLTSQYTGIVTGSPTVTVDGSYTVIKFTAAGSYQA
jgi:hypothetical protein